jgi:tRNA (guanine37-N1)-methyltransferase
VWVGVASLFPETFAALTAQGVVARAIGAGILTLSFENPREHAHDRHRTVDDRPYGGGPGMVMKTEPLKAAVAALAARAPVRPRRIYLSPQGQTLDQMRVEALAREPALLFIAGRYEGVDERFVESEIDEELSLGDFVLTGGELPIMVILDAVARHLPGVLGNAESATMESHRDGLLDCPHYTRPEDVAGRVVPAELLGGDHEVIRRWRLKMALGRTFERRPDLLLRRVLAAEERELLRTFLAERAGGAAAQRRESTHA